MRNALDIVSNRAKTIMADVPAANAADAAAELAALKSGLQDFLVVVQNKDRQEVPVAQQRLLGLVGNVEEDMVGAFPFEVPAEYDALPQLRGRATVEMTLRLKAGKSGDPSNKTAVLTAVLDGYNAPVSAGAFADLVQRKFYDGMEIQRSDGFVVQSGDPGDGKVGFSAGGKLRTVPLEIKMAGDKAPLYEETVEEAGRFKDDVALPFNAYGTMALARGEFDDNSASSQFFMLLKESDLTPSGTNILDGRYAVFGYVVDGQVCGGVWGGEGFRQWGGRLRRWRVALRACTRVPAARLPAACRQEQLRDVKVGDTIESVRILKGAELLKTPKGPPPAPEPEPAAAEPAAEAPASS